MNPTPDMLPFVTLSGSRMGRWLIAMPLQPLGGCRCGGATIAKQNLQCNEPSSPSQLGKGLRAIDKAHPLTNPPDSPRSEVCLSSPKGEVSVGTAQTRVA